MPPPYSAPSRAALRKLLAAALPTDAELDAFCIDEFPEVQQRFTDGMDRTSKANLLLLFSEPAELLRRLQGQRGAAVRRAMAVLHEDSPQTRTLSQLWDELELLFQQRELLTRRGKDCSAVIEQILRIKRQQRFGPHLNEGEVLADRYRLLEKVGHGGFSTVWQAFDRKNQQLVAAKVLHGQYSQDQSHLERFYRGARTLQSLMHRSVVRSLGEPSEHQGFHYFVMEYVSGNDLMKSVLQSQITRDQAINAILDIGDALQYAHTLGLIHRDVKPSNILLDEKQNAKLSDFDLVFGEDTTGGTRSGMAMGTFIYAAPEQLENAKRVDHRADIYSLGMTTLFVLHGKPLPSRSFQNPAELIAKLDCGEAVKTVLARAVSWELANRYKRISRFCTALRMAFEHPDQVVEPSGMVYVRPEQQNSQPSSPESSSGKWLPDPAVTKAAEKGALAEPAPPPPRALSASWSTAPSAQSGELPSSRSGRSQDAERRASAQSGGEPSSRSGKSLVGERGASSQSGGEAPSSHSGRTLSGDRGAALLVQSFKEQDRYLFCHVKDTPLLKSCRMLLRATIRRGDRQLAKAFCARAVMTSPMRLSQALQNGSRGLEIDFLEMPPAPLLDLPGAYYCQPRAAGSDWEDIVRYGQVAIHVSDFLRDNIHLELVLLKNSERSPP